LAGGRASVLKKSASESFGASSQILQPCFQDFKTGIDITYCIATYLAHHEYMVKRFCLQDKYQLVGFVIAGTTVVDRIAYGEFSGY
jgi:hypothetical protein